MHHDAISIFVSYAGEDTQYMKRLGAHLKGAEDQGTIQTWTDRELELGTEWDPNIREQIDRADIIVLLVSANWVASKHCQKELKHALERQDALIVPVQLLPCDFEALIVSKMTVLPKDNKPIIIDGRATDDRFSEVAIELRRTAERLRAKREIETPLDANDPKEAWDALSELVAGGEDSVVGTKVLDIGDELLSQNANPESIRKSIREVISAALDEAALRSSIAEEQAIVCCEQVGREYRKSGFQLTDVNLTLVPGDIMAVLGPNGSGKTTLMEILAGERAHGVGSLLYPSLGEANHWRAIKSKIAYVSQDTTGWPETVKIHLTAHARFQGISAQRVEKRIERVLHRLNILHLAEKECQALSGGETVRFHLAKILVWNPRLIILDEPLGPLDEEAQHQFIADLKRLSRAVTDRPAIVISSHEIHKLEAIANKLIVLDRGEVAYCGSRQGIKQHLGFGLFEVATSSTMRSWMKFASEALPDTEVSVRPLGLFLHIRTSRVVESHEMLAAIQRSSLQISYFRDLSNSTRAFRR